MKAPLHRGIFLTEGKRSPVRKQIRKTLGTLGLMLCLAALLVASILPAAAFDTGGGPELKYSPENPWVNYDKVILTYEENPAKGASQSPAYLRSVQGVSIASSRRMKHSPVEIVSLAGGNRIRSTAADRGAVLESFKRIPGVKTAEYDTVRKILGFTHSHGPRTTRSAGDGADFTAEQWYLDLVGAKEAWNTTKGDPSFTVAVIDTGVNLTHPDLAGAIWNNPGEIPNNGIDDDGNGFIDDYQGWNFVAGSKDANDDHKHGSHVSGIIAATDDGSGITGVACGVKILPLKILGKDGSGSSSNIIRALDMVCDFKTKGVGNIRAVNMSLGGGGYTQAEFLSLMALAAAGVPVFAAAGNESMDNDFYDFFPANYAAPNLVSVGSLDRENNLSWFTNTGTNRVGVYSYGSDIFSTVLGTEYEILSGTSMATPMACAVFLLGWSQNPGLTLPQALARFYSGLIPMPGVGGGRTNALNIMSVETDPVVLSNTADVYAFRGFDVSVFGNRIGSATFTLGGAAVDVLSASVNQADLRLNWGLWARGDLWRRLETPGYAASRSPLVMTLDVQAGTDIPVTAIPADRHLFKDGGFLQLGTTLYMIMADDTLFGRYLGVYDAENETYREFALPQIIGPVGPRYEDENYVRLFEHQGYIYIPGLVPFTETVMHRFSLLNETFSTVNYGSLYGGTMAFLKQARYASNADGSELYFAGASGIEGDYTYAKIFRFNPETGERTLLATLPHKLWDMAFTYHNGKLYIAGGERMPELFWFITANDCFVCDPATGELISTLLPFSAQGGQLLFSDNKLLYVLNRVNGDGMPRRILSAMTDLTESGKIVKWEVLPSVSRAILYEDTDTRALFFKYPGEPSLVVLSKNPVTPWNCRTFVHPAGTVQPEPGPDPDPDPDPAPSSGGGCSAGAASPLLLLLAAPLMLLVFPKRGK